MPPADSGVFPAESAATHDSLGGAGGGVGFHTLPPTPLPNPIAAAIGVPLRTDLLRRVRTGRKQEGLTLEERLENVANVFQAVQPDQLENKRILLIDDVITTGATISACARALMQAGAESVYAMSFATAEPDPAETSSPDGEKAAPKLVEKQPDISDSSFEEDDFLDF